MAPFGLLGGGGGAPGVNLWIRRDGRTVSLGGKATVQVQGGDRIRILTPGGGGYGPVRGAARLAADEAAAAEAQLAAKLAGRRGTDEFSAPLRDGGSVQQYTRNQETV